MIKITFTEQAFEEYIFLQNQDKKTLQRINSLLKDIVRNPFEGIGKPEELKNKYKGFWSRRIDEKNKIVYKIGNEVIEVYQCKGHYEDK